MVWSDSLFVFGRAVPCLFFSQIRFRRNLEKKSLFHARVSSVVVLHRACSSAGVRGPAAPVHIPVLVRRGFAAPHQNGGFGGATPRRAARPRGCLVGVLVYIIPRAVPSTGRPHDVALHPDGSGPDYPEIVPPHARAYGATTRCSAG